jgi:SnoaL-like domain
MTQTDGLADELLIRRTLSNYWLALDDRRLTEWVDLFCDDGGFIVRGESAGADAEFERASGRSEIQRVADAMGEFEAGQHIGSDPLITVTGSTAEARSTVLFITGRQDLSIRYVAACEDRLRKVGDSWLLEQRIMTMKLGVHAGQPKTG